jgi:hypothetical protein
MLSILRPILFISIFIVSLGYSTNAQCVSGFGITTSIGETVVNLCSGNSSPVIRVIADIRGFPIMYILTDDNGVIIESGTYPVFNLNGFPAGTYRIYAATFKGRIYNTNGEQIDDAELTSYCYGLSATYVTVVIGTSEESTVATSDGKLDTTFCSQDGLDDILQFDHTTAGPNYTFIITDDTGLILATTDDEMNFEGAPAGICYVYGIAYEGSLLATAGLTISDNLAGGCYALSDNRIEVTRRTTDPGTVMTSDSMTQKIICVGDGMSDSLMFISPGADLTANYAYVVTNDSDTIIGLPGGHIVDFEGAGLGICRVYGVAFTGSLTATLGMHVNDITSDGACQGITANYVEVVRTSPMEGRLETLSGDTLIYTCTGDSIADIITLKIRSGATPYIFIITDSDGVVLGMSTNQEIDFEGAGEGTCFVWRAAYTGALTIVAGDTLFVDPVSDGCYVLSDNAVEVRRASPEVGLIETMNGETNVNVCVGDGEADSYLFDGSWNLNAPFTFVVTNDTGQVLRFLAVGEDIDFDDAGSGTCRVYGLSYHGHLLIDVGSDLLNDDLAAACADLSDNFVEFVRSNVDPGVIFTQYGTAVFTCPGDGNPDELYLTQINDADTSIAFITDDHGVVLAILDSDTVDVEGAGVGNCLIWSLSFDGEVTLSVGDTLQGQNYATGCFSLSQPVFVLRRVPYTDSLMTVDGQTEVEFCTSDGIDDLLILNYPPVVDFPIAYVITDTSGMILGSSHNDTINFEGVPAGLCRVYGIAYTGTFSAVVGENIGSSDLSDDCYAISENTVEVTRFQPEGGEVSLEGGGDITYICVGDGIPNVLKFDRSSGSVDDFQYVITSEMNVILGLPMADSADFEEAPIGLCRVWAVAFQGNFIGELGDTITRNPMADGCYGLSDNFIEVVRDTAEAGTIETVQGETEVSINTTDTLPDLVSVVSVGASSAKSQFVITTEANLLLAVLSSNLIDFSAVPAAEYRVYHISFTGNLLLGGGSNVLTDAISDECYDVSDNFVRVTVTTSLQDDNHDLRPESFDALTSQGEDLGLKVFPNPVRDRLYFNQTKLATSAVLLNTMGQVVAQQRIEIGSENYFDAHSLTSGLYLLVIYQEGVMVDQQQVLVDRR